MFVYFTARIISMSTQTPIHEIANLDLLKIIPSNIEFLLEVGCSSGALAREYKKINPHCFYEGLEIDGGYAELAKRHCDNVLVGDIEFVNEDFWLKNSNVQCWIFADVLEHLKDPWSVLKKIHHVLPEDGFIVACIPNVQHWSIQVDISLGNFRYQDIGLLDKTHLRWFTRKTIVELFESTGYKIVDLTGRIVEDSRRENYLSIIQRLATRAGGNASEAMNDALAHQYLVRAIKK